MKSLKEQIEVMQAAENGEDIEMTNQKARQDYWGMGASHRFNWDLYDYRVKHKPLEFWMNIYDDGTTIVQDSEKELEIYTKERITKTIKVREVTDD